jgi:hypothetical protein
MLIIGHSANPRCFKAKLKDADYTSNDTAWVNYRVVEVWMNRLNAAFASHGIYIALILDNLAAYKKAKLNLTHVTLYYLPTNCTSLIQGMDQSIIWNLKVLYRKRVLESRLEKLRNNQKCYFTFYDACLMLEAAWNDVTEDTIVNSFKHAWSFAKTRLEPAVFQHLQISPSQTSDVMVSSVSADSSAPSQSGLSNLGNSCYLNTCLQAISVSTSTEKIKQELLKPMSDLNRNVCSVVIQLQTGVVVNGHELGAIVQAFRSTLDA